MKIEVIEKENDSTLEFPCLMRYINTESSYEGSIFYAFKEESDEGSRRIRGFYLGDIHTTLVSYHYLEKVKSKVVLENE